MKPEPLIIIAVLNATEVCAAKCVHYEKAIPTNDKKKSSEGGEVFIRRKNASHRQIITFTPFVASVPKDVFFSFLQMISAHCDKRSEWQVLL